MSEGSLSKTLAGVALAVGMTASSGAISDTNNVSEVNASSTNTTFSVDPAVAWQKAKLFSENIQLNADNIRGVIKQNPGIINQLVPPVTTRNVYGGPYINRNIFADTVDRFNRVVEHRTTFLGVVVDSFIGGYGSNSDNLSDAEKKKFADIEKKGIAYAEEVREMAKRIAVDNLDIGASIGGIYLVQMDLEEKFAGIKPGNIIIYMGDSRLTTAPDIESAERDLPDYFELKWHITSCEDIRADLNKRSGKTGGICEHDLFKFD